VKQDYVEHYDSSNDDESNEEDGIDSIFDFVNDSVNKKIINKFKKKKALIEENYRKELDEMIGIHKNLTSDLDQKHNQEILELKNKHKEANMKMRKKHEREMDKLVEKKWVKLESITKQEKEVIMKFCTVLKGAKRKFEEEDEEEEEKDEDCPICFDMMTPPKKIYQCAEGHLVCSECKPRILSNNCATCKSGQGYISRCRWIEERIARKSTKRVKHDSSEGPRECEVRISLSKDITRDMEEPRVAGVYRADGTYYNGRPVFRHSGGKFTLSVCGADWEVSAYGGACFLSSGSAPSMCPADPRAARCERLGQTHWMYRSKVGIERESGDIRVTCNKHKY